MGIDHGVHRHLLSIRERRVSGDLIIVITDVLGGVDYKITHEKYSVHNSPNSDGTTVNYLQENSAGQKRQHASFINGPRNQLCWPLLMHRFRGCDTNEADRVKANDRVFVLPAYSSHTFTLILSLVVSDRDLRPPASDSWGLHEMIFSKFRIGVYYSWILSPSHQSSENVQLLTSSPTINGFIQGSFREPADPASEDTITSYLAATRKEIIHRYSAKFKDLLVNDMEFHGLDETTLSNEVSEMCMFWELSATADAEKTMRDLPELGQDTISQYSFPEPEYLIRSGQD